ncbi:hypothetical protein GCM10027456_43810 [Kineosporia babensis]
MVPQPGQVVRTLAATAHMAISRASRTSSTRLFVEARQPRIRREKASITKATWTVPAYVATCPTGWAGLDLGDPAGVLGDETD